MYSMSPLTRFIMNYSDLLLVVIVVIALFLIYVAVMAFLMPLFVYRIRKETILLNTNVRSLITNVHGVIELLGHMKTSDLIEDANAHKNDAFTTSNSD